MKGIECAFCGVLSTDPVLKTGKNGKNFANFSCTVSGEADDQRVNVICFGDISEQIAKTARKGDSVYCEGVLSLASWQNSDGEARSGLAVSAWRAEKLGNIGRDRAENPRGGSSPTSGEQTFPIALPARKKPAFGLFRRKKKAKTSSIEPDKTQDYSENERPFDDALPF